MNDELIECMHPEGSANDIKYFEPAPPRELYRPTVNYLVAVSATLAAAVLSLLVYCLIYEICVICKLTNEYGHICGTALSIGTALVTVYITRKQTLVWFITLYQHYAPTKVRRRCLFTPSCSEYMAMAILKYGAIRGIVMGIKRLLRCHKPNGGHDYP